MSQSDELALSNAIHAQPPSLLIFDLDGTVVAGADKVDSEISESLTKINLPVAIATGRPWFGAEHIAKLLPTSGVSMFSSGAHFLTPKSGQLAKAVTIPSAILKKLHARAVELGIFCEYYTVETYFCDEISPFSKIHQEYLHRYAVNIGSLDTLGDENVVIKVVLVTDSENGHQRQKNLATEFPELSFAFSYGAAHPTILFGNVAAKEASRQAAFEFLCTAHRVSAESVYSFGDSPADATFLKLAGLGFAIGSSHPEAMAAADFTMPDVEHGGVVKVLREILKWQDRSFAKKSS